MEYGYVIADRYICRKSLGKGSNGRVFLAFDQKINKFWAIKACSELSKREIYALKSINHYAFPRIVDVISQDNTEFIVMDYIEGETLSSYCKRHYPDEKQIIRWGYKIATALSYLHNLNPPVYYIDCKPDNIMITPSGDIRIIDLGSIYIESEHAPDESITGTKFYAPKELSTDSPNASTDIYCLGMTLYRLLTGSNIEYRDSRKRLCPEHINKNLSSSICKIIKRCTNQNPSKRYQSMEDLANDLHELTGSKHPGRSPFSNVIHYIVKFSLSVIILIIAQIFKSKALYPLILLVLILFLVCKKPNYYSWETKKTILKSAITSAIILILFLSAPSFKSFAKKDAPTMERLDISLYDEYFRKLLVRPGAEWEVKKDIVFSLPTEELSDSTNTITIICENASGVKSYSFNCRYTKN